MRKHYKSALFVDLLRMIYFITTWSDHAWANCRYRITKNSGAIQSPEFPRVRQEHNCVWDVTLEKGTYLRLDLDTVQLFYKDEPWWSDETENICSQTLKIGQEDVGCHTTSKECLIFHLDNGCTIPSSVYQKCNVYKWSYPSVRIRFTSDGETGWIRYKRNYPKGFRMLYSRNDCIGGTTETTQTTLFKETTTPEILTSSSRVTTSPLATSQHTTASKGRTRQPIDTKNQPTSNDASIQDTTHASPHNGAAQKGMGDGALVALIVSCFILLLLTVAFVIFLISRKRAMDRTEAKSNSKDAEMVYSVAYGRLDVGGSTESLGRSTVASQQNIEDEGFIYSTVAVNQINGSSQQTNTGLKSDNATYETMPDIVDVTSHADCDTYASVITTSDNKTKRKTTFRYKVDSPAPHQSRQMVNNVLYEY